MNIHLMNVSNTDFISKGAKKRMKLQIKEILNDDKSLNDYVDDIQEKYFIKNKVVKLELDLEKKDNDAFITIKWNKRPEVLRRNKLKQRIQQIKNHRTSGGKKRNELLTQEKNERKMINTDERITPEMHKMYYLVKNKFKNGIPNPIDLLDNKEKHTKEFVNYIANIMEQYKDKNELLQIVDNDYTKYICLIIEFDYKKFIDIMLTHHT